LNNSYQEELFGEDLSIGQPFVTMDSRFTSFLYCLFAQKQAVRFVLNPYNLPLLTSERLVDVTYRGELQLLHCSLHFVKNGQYGRLDPELMFIMGNSIILSIDDARSKLESLEKTLQGIINLANVKNKL
jgi:hypothetical protein